MNLTALLNYGSMRHAGEQMQANQQIDIVADSIRQFIEQSFMQLGSSFVVVVSCLHLSTIHFYESVLDHLHRNIDDMIIQLIYVKHEQPRRLQGSFLQNLLLVDSLEAFLDINIASYTNLMDSSEYYYIFLREHDRNISGDMKGIFEYCWENQLSNCNVQIHNRNGDLLMYTYFPFAAEHCNKIVPVIINRFNGTHWLSLNFFPSKFHNFYQCTIYAAIRNVPPYLEVKKLTHNTYEINGLESYLLKQLSSQLNFSLGIIVPTIAETHAQRAGNFSVGTYGLLTSRKAHLAVGYFRKRTTIHSTLASSTFPHYQSSLVASIFLNAHNLTTYEILVFPFAINSWIAIIFSFIGTTFAVVFLQQKLRNPHGGNDRYLAIFPTLTAALGVPLSRVIDPTTERFLYISWVLATFLIRTIYAALLFHFFGNFVHKEIPASFWELLRQGYATAINNFTLLDLAVEPYVDEFHKMRSVIFNSSLEDIVFPYLESHVMDKVFAITSREFLVHYATKHRMPGKFCALKDIVAQQQLTLRLPKHSYLTQIFDQSIMAIQAVGLMDIWTEWTFNDEYFKSLHLYTKKLVKQKDLQGLYVIVCVLHFMALVVFVLEILSARIKMLQKIFLKI